MHVRRAARRLLLTLLVTAAALAALYGAILRRFAIEPAVALSAGERDGILSFLREAAAGHAGAMPRLEGRPTAGPIWATLYHQGQVLARERDDHPALGQAVARLAAKLRRSAALRGADARALRSARLKVDVCTATAPIASQVPLLFAHSLAPGVDGLGLETDAGSAYLLPDDLLRRDWLAAAQPFYFMPEFRAGLDVSAAITALADSLHLTLEAWRRARKRFFRFRVESFIEPAGAGQGGRSRGARQVLRLRVPEGRVGRAEVRAAAVRAADYVVRQIRADGRFHYIYYPIENQHSADGEYNLPRHAGTTWFLALAYRELGYERHGRAARRAIDYLVAHAVPPACSSGPSACVGSDDYASLGASALSLVAIAEYQLATRDLRFMDLARRLGRFIVDMQRGDGEFCHEYRPRQRRRDCRQRLLYYSGEAAFALAKLYELTRAAHLLRPLERALDYLVGPNYDFFLGQFLISEDHWTCIAAEAAPPQVRKQSHLEFCRAFGALNRRVQIHDGEDPLRDLAGAFTITPFFMPHNTPVGSRTEANIATYLLSRAWNRPDELLADTIRLSVRYLVDQQIRPDDAYLFPDPDAATGGMFQTPVRPLVRIDFVQHAASAMLRSLSLFTDHGR